MTEIRQRGGAKAAQDSPELKGKTETKAEPSAFATGRALILLQLFSRLLTFALNQGLIRTVSPSVLGTASVQFDLVSATILFIGREGVRNALLRSNSPLSPSERRLASVPLLLGTLVAALTTTLYIYTSAPSTTSQKAFYPALTLYVLGPLIELSVEKWYISTIRAGRLRVRVAADGGQAAVRAAVSFALVAAGYPLMGMAIGYISGSIWWAGRIFMAGYESTEVETADSRALAFANTRQGVIKHVLTEADRIAVGRISPLKEQGGYAVATNYGSLIARILFQPVEETLLLHWSRNRTPLPLLSLALRFSTYLTLLLPTFLPPLLPTLLPLLLPRKYITQTTAGLTLQTYLTAYIPILSLNGILEAFHAASASPAEVARQAKVMIASSATFAASLVLLSKYGIWTTEQALIYASCSAMAVRIAYALNHARSRGLNIRSVLPKPSVVVAVAVLGGGVWFAESRLGSSVREQAMLIGVGGGAGLGVLAVIYLEERGDVGRLGDSLRDKRE